MDKKSDGFTLIELIVVIAILGIIAVIVIQRLFGLKNIAEERVCVANRKTVERMYATFLIENRIGHMESIFNQFLIDHVDEVCPAGGVIRYEEGKLKCSIHEDAEPSDEEAPGEEVPWL